MNTNDAISNQADQMEDEVDRDRFYYRTTLKWIGSHPEQLPRLIAVKALYALSPWDWEIISSNGTARYHWVYGLFFLPLCIGIIQAGRSPLAGAVLVPMAYYLFLCFVFYGSPRFRLPFEPFGALIAAHGLVSLIQGNRDKTYLVGTAGGVLVFVGLTFGLLGSWRGWI